MYRATALYFTQNQVAYETELAEVEKALENIRIDFIQQPQGPGSEKFYRTLLNGEDVESAIRTPEISDIVSQVSALASVRTAMVKEQQRMGQKKGVVMDGRDIGTVVFPDAELKIFMTANMDLRAQRRQIELQQRGISNSLEQIKGNLAKRDHLDSTRKIGPLKQAADAIVIDTSNLTIHDQVNIVYQFALERIDGTSH